MDQDQKRTYISWGLSAGIHLVVVIALTISGVFAFLSEKSQDPPVAVDIYDVDAGGSDSSGSGGAPEAIDVVDTVDDISIPDPTTPVEEQPEKTKETAQPAESQQQGTTSSSASGSGTGTEGNGDGEGNGTGHGAGTGNGDGTGNGSSAKRPKTPPSYVGGSLPVYPENLRAKGIQGTVVLSLLVGADGSVQEASIASSSGYGEMDQAAIAAASSYQFTPATNDNDEPVPCRVSWPVAFHF